MIQEYDENRIKSETKQTLFWMGRAAKSLRDGDATMSHVCIINALHHIMEIALTQEKIKVQNNYEHKDIGYEEIYIKALAQAKKEIGEENEQEIA